MSEDSTSFVFLCQNIDKYIMDDRTLASNYSELIGMGFDETEALNALLKSSSLEEAIEFMLKNLDQSDFKPKPVQAESVLPSNSPFKASNDIPSLNFSKSNSLTSNSHSIIFGPSKPQDPILKPLYNNLSQTFSNVSKDHPLQPSKNNLINPNIPVPYSSNGLQNKTINFGSGISNMGTYNTVKIPAPNFSVNNGNNGSGLNLSSSDANKLPQKEIVLPLNPPKFQPVSQNILNEPFVPISEESSNIIIPPSEFKQKSFMPDPLNDEVSVNQGNSEIAKHPTIRFNSKFPLPVPSGLNNVPQAYPTIPMQKVDDPKFPFPSVFKVPNLNPQKPNLINNSLLPLNPFSAGKNNSDFKAFLENRLLENGLPLDLVREIVNGCNSKAEALLILDIPTYYEGTPFDQIPGSKSQALSDDIINDHMDIDVPREQIKAELLKDGVDVHTAEYLSLTCTSLEEAFEKLNQEDAQKVNFPVPKLNIPPLPSKLSTNPFKFNQKPLNVPKAYSNSFSSDSSFDDFIPSPFIPSNNISSKIVNLSAPSDNDPVAPDSKTDYFNSLKGFRLTMNEDPSIFQYFGFQDPVSHSAASLKRINSEIKTLSTSVPCDSSASIFVMVDSSCMHRMKILLSGTLDTPYAHGLYAFDVLLPTNYPANPPKVQIKTTGNGVMRFNPNLYSNGYVCLSVINTWSGRPEERWNPSSSTLLQVMLSIQSLVMDNDVIQKEPSFVGLPTNALENLGYHFEVKYGNLKFAMIDMIKNPPKGFENVVREHFKIKKNEILQSAKIWKEEAKGFNGTYGMSQNATIVSLLSGGKSGKVFEDLYQELEYLLNRIG